MSFICLLNGRKEAKNDSWLEIPFLASPLLPHLCLHPCSNPQNLIFGVFPFIPGALGLGLRLRIHLLGSAEAVGVGGQPGAALFFSFFNAPSSIYSEPTAGQPAMRCSPWGHARTPAGREEDTSSLLPAWSSPQRHWRHWRCHKCFCC